MENTSYNKHEAVEKACAKIAPLWSLENFVAVNPYLGHTENTFEQTATLLDRIANINMTMPLEFYLKAVDSGDITLTDVQQALKNVDWELPEAKNLISQLRDFSSINTAPNHSTPLLMDMAQKYLGKDWGQFITDRITSWASDYFDKGQAIWHTTDRSVGPFSSWKTDATHDLTPKVMGMKAFHGVLNELPNQADRAIEQCLDILNLPSASADVYLHALLLRVGGWASYVAGQDWNDRLYGNDTSAIKDFLAILLCWETALYREFEKKGLADKWGEMKYKFQEELETLSPDFVLQGRLVLQKAYDLSAQKKLAKKFSTKKTTAESLSERPKAQAVFCIDVRSEVYRRNLELVDENIETLGFAGFFGFPVNYVPLAHEHGVDQCPALIPAPVTVKETVPNQEDQIIKKRKQAHQLHKIWKEFRHGAVTCFSFVSPLGISYLPKLLTDSMGWTRPVDHPDQKGLDKVTYNHRVIRPEESIPLADQVEMAKKALSAMSLTKDFARLVFIVGHGSSSVNNPHATGLDCGACGGRSGEANAKVASAVLNAPEVRAELAKDGILIPEDTYFVASLHDTSLDEVSVFHGEQIPESHQSELKELEKAFAQAGQVTRTERAVRFGIENKEKADSAVLARSRDWSQVRPEWGLAGCNAFVIAPRHRTKGIDLSGKSFLHSYDWKQDQGFKILEAIMTAPMVVTSWINLQYFASTVDNLRLGAGNKTLHNITGGIGVLEGAGGDLRVGLPWQSVHDGKNYQHLPQRLNVVIEAPKEAIGMVLEKHDSVRNLCDNGWISLLTMDEQGTIAYRYIGAKKWEPIVKTNEAPERKKLDAKRERIPA